VNPGTGSQPAPLPPPIDVVVVDVLKPDGTVLATADNTGGGAGSVLSLLGVTFTR